jgi:hypothetical protein
MWDSVGVVMIYDEGVVVRWFVVKCFVTSPESVILYNLCLLCEHANN